MRKVTETLIEKWLNLIVMRLAPTETYPRETCPWSP